MATSIRAGVLLTRTYNFAHTAILTNTKYVPSALSNLQFVRGSRRTLRPPSMWPKRKAGTRHRRELIPENQAFLTDLHASEYEDRLSPLREEPWERQDWTPGTNRTGVIAIKIGTQCMWTKEGKKFHTTLLQVVDNHAIRYVPPEVVATYPYCKLSWRHKGYGFQVVGALSSDPFTFTKAYNNLFQEAGVPPKRKLSRFLVSPNAAVQPGTPLYATHFRVGDYVDCQAKTIGHGFQGVVKRWGFKGGPASHGATKFQRRPGSTGGGGNKSAVWKGKKMPGHMGMERRTLKGLRIWRINTEYNVLYVTGPNVPGPTHCYVRVMDSVLRPHTKSRIEDSPPLPTWTPDDDPDLPEDIYDERLFQFGDPTITHEEIKSK